MKKDQASKTLAGVAALFVMMSRVRIKKPRRGTKATTSAMWVTRRARMILQPHTSPGTLRRHQTTTI